MARFPRSLASPPPMAAGFLLPLSATASLLLVLSSVSLQAAALQARSQVQTGQRLRQAEDRLMSAAQHLLAAPATPVVGQTGQVGPVAYSLVAFDGPHWDGALAAGGLQRGRAAATLELEPTAEQPQPCGRPMAWSCPAPLPLKAPAASSCWQCGSWVCVAAPAMGWRHELGGSDGGFGDVCDLVELLLAVVVE